MKLKIEGQVSLDSGKQEIDAAVVEEPIPKIWKFAGNTLRRVPMAEEGSIEF